MAQANEQIAALAAEVAELRSQLAAMQDKVDAFDQYVADWAKQREIDEDTLLAISAAVAAALGHKAKIRQIHFGSGQGWSAAGRAAVQDRTVDRQLSTTPLRST